MYLIGLNQTNLDKACLTMSVLMQYNYLRAAPYDKRIKELLINYKRNPLNEECDVDIGKRELCKN